MMWCTSSMYVHMTVWCGVRVNAIEFACIYNEIFIINQFREREKKLDSSFRSIFDGAHNGWSFSISLSGWTVCVFHRQLLYDFSEFTIRRDVDVNGTVTLFGGVCLVNQCIKHRNELGINIFHNCKSVSVELTPIAVSLLNEKKMYQRNGTRSKIHGIWCVCCVTLCIPHWMFRTIYRQWVSQTDSQIDKTWITWHCAQTKHMYCHKCTWKFESN